MSFDNIITVENLGKKYRIGHQQAGLGTAAIPYTALRDVLTDRAKNLFRRNGKKALTSDLRSPTSEDFWALKDVSFEVKRGEVVGIIGRNGAGKTTLLKILSRITEPTEGRVRIRGRVASLLEVGTGFHPELTGRENIFLNGAILGMTRAEIKSKFDEIVAFAETENFLDTPVKRYSSGMYVRLAFAVAAHLEPEILVVDEVLAVGDVEFQKKCLGKMRDVSKSGRTVLFVSHNMPAIQQLCDRGMVVSNGRLVFAGQTTSAVVKYLNETSAVQQTPLNSRRDRKGDGRLRFVSVSFHDFEGNEIQSPLCGEALRVRLHYQSQFRGEEHDVDVAFKLRNDLGLVLTSFANTQTAQTRMPVYERGFFECNWPKVNLRSGGYDCALFCAVDRDVCDWLQNAFTISLEDGDFYRSGHLVSRDHGDVLCDYEWTSGADPTEAVKDSCNL